MLKEISIFGVYLPPILGYMAAATLLWFPLRRVLERLRFYRLVWHPALFNAALYLLILSAIVLIVQ